MLNKKILTLLEEKKAESIVSLTAHFIDSVIIASGTSSRHVKSLALHLMKELKPNVYHVEGMELGDWVLLDCENVVVHLFKPEIREFYNLEELITSRKPKPSTNA